MAKDYKYDKKRDDFGTRLREMRIKAGYDTQEEFAAALGRNIDTIRKWEQGKKVPEGGTLLTIAELLDCDIDYLFKRINCTTHDLEFMTDQLGLSEEAIKKIMRMSKIQVQIISEIIEHPKFGRMTEHVNNLKNKDGLNDATFILAVNHVTKGIKDQNHAPVHENMIEQAIIYNLSNLFTQIVCDITDTEL